MKIIDSSVPTLQLAHLAEMEVKHRCNQILELGFPLGGLARLFAQDWEGDVTVVMPATLAQVCNKILLLNFSSAHVPSWSILNLKISVYINIFVKLL